MKRLTTIIIRKEICLKKLLSKYRNDNKVKPYYIELLEYFRNKEYFNIYHKIYLLKDEIDIERSDRLRLLRSIFV